ncbi:hypothetical protein KTAU_33150 [Thermogemmatispora aurantia]|uniref:Uncharacterized protein n=1 Tax=Thermogemmatispora aurantia TaxID=2045279 RepID=A0A5J4KDJ5_9CHLR|nr:hypothetical protein KTAU_33150 [Thermogemmatispora aurantia]
MQARLLLHFAQSYLLDRLAGVRRPFRQDPDPRVATTNEGHFNTHAFAPNQPPEIAYRFPLNGSLSGVVLLLLL